MTNDRLLSGVDFGCHVDEAKHTLFQVENFYIDVNSRNTPAEPEPQTSRETMYVSGRNLYSPTGEKVVDQRNWEIGGQLCANRLVNKRLGRGSRPDPHKMPQQQYDPDA